ncbi:MAG: DHH family phosphoesterase, partial [Candidatus Eremiobacteraeota bacterium]|nr:DHH family phosphoesterase [Candidatus Eremiobacteraeota bacterium]
MIESQPRVSSAREVADELRRRNCFVMVSHVKPDGDTLGAGFALGLALKRLGKRVLYFADAIPRNLRFLPEAQYATRELPVDLPSDTLFVFCDMSDWRRAGDGLPALTRENMLDIDHHLGNALFGKFNFVLETECSTGSVVMHLLRELGAPLDASIATCILTTIMTDTGGFMHSNTTAEALELSAQLIRLGADKEKITE